MSNSKLVSYTRLSPNHSGKRRHAIDTISIHCMAGNLSVESCGRLFADRSREASSNYGIGSDGRIALYVDEGNRSWCTSSASNDNRAVTIEVANCADGEPWPITEEAYRSLINLLVDICKRNHIPELRWKGDQNLVGQVEKQNMTVHRWFANKSCPGNWLYEHHGKIAKEVNERLEEENMVRYERLRDIKNKEFHDIVEKLMDANILGGDGSDPTGNEDIIDLSHDMVRTLVLEYRGGAFDRKLKAVGMEPAVKD